MNWEACTSKLTVVRFLQFTQIYVRKTQKTSPFFAKWKDPGVWSEFQPKRTNYHKVDSPEVPRKEVGVVVLVEVGHVLRRTHKCNKYVIGFWLTTWIWTYRIEGKFFFMWDKVILPQLFRYLSTYAIWSHVRTKVKSEREYGWWVIEW